MNPWYKRTYRWCQTNLTEDDPIKCDIEFWKKYWQEADIQGVIINCGGIVSYYQTEKPFQYKAKYLGDQDFYAKFSNAARELGLTVIARMDINCTTKEFYEKYPSWFCIDREGNPIKTQGRYVACVNGGYYKEFIPLILKEIILKYRPDGFTDNSWTGLGKNQICYCNSCQQDFKNKFGLELPKEVAWKDPVYRKWIRWSYDCRIKNWQLFNQITAKYGGPDCLWLGMINADPFQTGNRFFDIKRLVKDTPFLFCDHQSRDMYNGFEQNSLNGALLRMASDNDALVAESMAQYYKGIRTFRLTANPKEETLKWMLSGIAGGILPWIHFVGGGTLDRRKFNTSKKLYEWHKKYENFLVRRKNIANVGIVWSQQNIDFYGREDVLEKSAYPWIGFTRVLSKYSIPFLPIHADDIAKYSEQIDTLILPDVAILSDKQQKAICDYIDKGKNLIITGKTGLLDAEGEALIESQLWNKLGLKFTNENLGTIGKNEYTWLNHDTHSYLRLPMERHPIFEGFEETDILPFGGYIHVVRSEGKLEQICSYIPPFPIYPPEFSWIRGENPDVGLIFAGVLDSGSRVVYFAGDFDRCYGRNLIPDQGMILANAIKWATNYKFPVSIHGYGHVNCNIYMQDNSIILHLVNLSGCDGPVGTCDALLPIGPVKVTINRELEVCDTAMLTVAGSKVQIKKDESEYSFIIDMLEDHELIIIHLEN